MDLLKAWFIVGIPADHKQQMYLSEAAIYEFAVSCTWEGFFMRDNKILPFPFETKEAADGMRDLIAGRMTDGDFNALYFIQLNPGASFLAVKNRFKKNNTIGDSVGKLLRVGNVISDKKGNMQCTDIGLTTLKNYKKGLRDMNQANIKVVSMAEVLKHLKITGDQSKNLTFIERNKV